MAKSVNENHPVVLLTLYLAAKKQGDAKQAARYRAKLQRRGIKIEQGGDSGQEG